MPTDVETLPGQMEASQQTPQTHDAAGIDRTLIRWMLGLTPTERLLFLQSSIAMVASARPLPHGPR